jgi:cell division septation protein DedD
VSDQTLSTLLLESPVSTLAEPEGSGEAGQNIEMQLSRVDAAIASLKRAQANLQRHRASVPASGAESERRRSVLQRLEDLVEAGLLKSADLRQALSTPGGLRRQATKSEPVETVRLEPAPVEAAPAEAAPSAETEPKRRDFLALSSDEQIDIVWELLLGQGALDKREAARLVAEELQGRGFAASIGTSLAEAIEAAFQKGLQESSFDRPRRGTVRAVLFDAKDYQPEDWQRCLLAVLGPEPAGIDDTLRAAAEWARDTLGLEWTRLRTGGVILTPLQAALDELVEDEIVLRRGMTVWSA